MRPTSESGQMDALEKIFSNPKKNWVNLLLIGINGILFLLAELAGSTLDNGWAIRWGASYTPLIQAGEYWRLFTSMFYHFGFQHLFNNMLLLLFLVILMVMQFASVSKLAALLQIPYLLWLIFAGYLNLSIFLMTL